MPVAVRLRYVEDVYGKNAGAEQRDYYRQHTAAAAVILFSHLAGHHVPAAVQYGGYPDRRQLCGYPGAGGCGVDIMGTETPEPGERQEDKCT